MTGKKLAIGLVSVAVIGLAAVGIVSMNSDKDENTSNNNLSNNSNVATPTSKPTSTQNNSSEYKDGEYSADGSYTSPGGRESVSIVVVLKDNIIETVEFTGKANNSTSKQYQSFFVSGYESKVVGKKIDDVNLDKVSGSSLTGKGFMDALNKIKSEAKG